MSKEHSEQDTRIGRHSSPRHSKPHPLLEQARQAAQYYARRKLDELQANRDLYFQRMAHLRNSSQPHSPSPPKRKKKKKLRKLLPTPAEHRPNRTTKRRQKPALKQPPSEEEEQEQESAVVGAEVGGSGEAGVEEESALSAVGKYEIRAVHETMLEMQTTIDSYLSYQLSNRRKLTVGRAEFMSFLRTTRFALSCQRYLHYLAIYHPRLYRWQDDRLYCLSCSPQQMHDRLQLTRQRMTQIPIPALLI